MQNSFFFFRALCVFICYCCCCGSLLLLLIWHAPKNCGCLVFPLPQIKFVFMGLNWQLLPPLSVPIKFIYASTYMYTYIPTDIYIQYWFANYGKAIKRPTLFIKSNYQWITQRFLMEINECREISVPLGYNPNIYVCACVYVCVRKWKLKITRLLKSFFSVTFLVLYFSFCLCASLKHLHPKCRQHNFNLILSLQNSYWRIKIKNILITERIIWL